MNPLVILCLLQFAIASIAEAEHQLSITSGVVESGNVEEREHLAAAIFDLFRGDLEAGAGQPSKRLENSGLVLIRGAKFRTVKSIAINDL